MPHMAWNLLQAQVVVVILRFDQGTKFHHSDVGDVSVVAKILEIRDYFVQGFAPRVYKEGVRLWLDWAIRAQVLDVME